jgi:ABC-type glycerol-3-phosphate transport system substrate-binding protein
MGPMKTTPWVINDDSGSTAAGRLTRRVVLGALVGGVAGVPVLAACGASGGGATDGRPAEVKRYDGVVLSYWTTATGAGNVAMQRYWDRFADEKAPGLRIETTPVTNPEYLPKLTASIVGGAPPDICRFKENLNNDMAARRNTLAVDGYLSRDRSVRLADFTPQSVESLKFKDKQHGIPQYHQYVLLGWNKTLFRQSGLDPEKPPQTWQEMREVAKRLTIADREQWGFRLYEFGPPPREQIFNWFMEWVWRNGGDVWNRERTRATVDSPPSIESLQVHLDMIYGDRSTIPPDLPQIAIQTGKLGMWMPTGVGVLNLRTTNPELDFGLGPMPRNKQFATQIQTNSFALMAGAKHHDIAWGSVAYMAREDVMQAWQSDPQLQTVPVRKALLEKAPWSDPATGWKPIIDVLKMPGNRAKPHIPDWDEYTEKNIVPHLTAAWRREKSPREALAEAARQANLWLDARPKDR